MCIRDSLYTVYHCQSFPIVSNFFVPLQSPQKKAPAPLSLSLHRYPTRTRVSPNLWRRISCWRLVPLQTIKHQLIRPGIYRNILSRSMSSSKGSAAGFSAAEPFDELILRDSIL